MMISAGHTQVGDRYRPARALALATTVCVLLCACSGDRKDKPASQVVAKVNKEEISVHQLNYSMQRQPAPNPAQAASAGRRTLERLIDEEVVLQKAAESRMDRDPVVLQAIDAARRDIVFRAYLNKLSEQSGKPGEAAVEQYFDANPALFSERRIYSFQEISIDALPEQIELLKERLKAAKSVAEFADYLRANEFKFVSSQTVRAAEQLPLASLSQIARLKDGEFFFAATPTGGRVVAVVDSQSQPVTQEKARPVIEKFLLSELRRKRAEEEVKALRGNAKIEYVGEFSQAAASSPLSPAVALARNAPASAALDIDKGLKGFK